MSASPALKNKFRDPFILFATLMLFWVMLVNSLETDRLLIGALVSLIVALLYRDGLSFFTEFRWTPRAVIAGIAGRSVDQMFTDLRALRGFQTVCRRTGRARCEIGRG